MKKKQSINLLDVTLREGSYLVDFKIQPSDVTHIVDFLDHANVSHIEVGHGSGLGGTKMGYPSLASDVEYIEAAREGAKKAKLGVLVPTNSCSIPELDEIRSLVDFVRIGVNAHEVANAFPFIERAKKHGLFTFVQLMRSPLLPSFRLGVAARKVEKAGADVIYIVDTMGSLTPKTVKEYVKAVKGNVGVPVGFHAHNNLTLAVANSLEAVRSGCKWVDASLLGVGRQAGNAQLEVLALLLQKEGFHTPVDIPLLLDTAESLIAPMIKNYKGIDPFDLWAASCNLDLYPRWHFQQLALAVGLDTKSFIKELSSLKTFAGLDEENLLLLSKRFKVPYDRLLKAIQTPLNLVKSND
ncbi:MAG: hypothetical protein U1F57_06230 [bacterium]